MQLVAATTDLDVIGLVDEAIENDDWDRVYDVLDGGIELFMEGGPLAHVRFRSDRITERMPDELERSQLCTTGWQRWCEQEIVHVFGRDRMSQDQRDGLRLAAHLVRRFGARSAIVHAVSQMQVAEHLARMRALANAMSARGLARDEIGAAWPELLDWIERAHPVVLPFADWFVLRGASADEARALWQSGIAARVCDSCLDRLDAPILDDARQWALLAGMALHGNIPRLGFVLARVTRPRTATAEEARACEGVEAGAAVQLLEIFDATEARGDFAGAALLRAAVELD